ncbi:MAG: tRNA (adenosine(37)-N6)-threonylcarbamoyltransferase complex dimerization subunit type 1 TsaB [Clostridia bacterium]|nr:tRNA (adenosine(37)-N6)-threonylcarbamoyltransferase complex dimerization subunit type 1 TsaB [Clostridia bacterium]
MKILSIDTSSKICSVSILEDCSVLLEKHTDDEKTHSQNLMPLIDEIFKETNLTLDNIDLLACSQGPGSFTGIRIGIATIKAFADAKNIPVVGVTSLESLAYNISEPGLIVSLIDAKNDNVYYSLFSNNGTTYSQIGEFKSDSIQNILDDLSIYDDKLIFVGDGAVNHHDKIANLIKNSVFAHNIQNQQTSISIGKSAYNKFKNGIYGDSNSLSPIYLKKSQAERNLVGEK